jgi:hypothetical protein
MKPHKAPNKLKTTGINFIEESKNSASNKVKLLISLIGPIECLKKGEPGPIIISLNNQPINILPKAKIIKGKDIFKGNSLLGEFR